MINLTGFNNKMGRTKRNKDRPITCEIVHEPEGTEAFILLLVGPLIVGRGDPMAADDRDGFDYEKFQHCIKEIVAISDHIQDGWQLQVKEGLDNGHYMTKKASQVLEKTTGKLIVVFEYHIAYNINYGVPVLCFVAWKQDGSLLQMDEYCECNKNFSDSDILSTLTQLDHPVLCKPFLTLHPCRTREIMDSFLGKSKNPVVSWMSVISPFLNLRLDEEYVSAC